MRDIHWGKAFLANAAVLQSWGCPSSPLAGSEIQPKSDVLFIYLSSAIGRAVILWKECRLCSEK